MGGLREEDTVEVTGEGKRVGTEMETPLPLRRYCHRSVAKGRKKGGGEGGITEGGKLLGNTGHQSLGKQA